LLLLNTYDYRATDQFEDKMKEKCNEIQSSIDLENGPLVKLALFKTENGEHLLITIHHLVIDGVSWRILLEDFSEGYRQVSRGRKVEFQAKSNSFMNGQHTYKSSWKLRNFKKSFFIGMKSKKKRKAIAFRLLLL
jgi:iturin family lipopeptide synthetase B